MKRTEIRTKCARCGKKAEEHMCVNCDNEYCRRCSEIIVGICECGGYEEAEETGQSIFFYGGK
jgi:hypothetical protein